MSRRGGSLVADVARGIAVVLGISVAATATAHTDGAPPPAKTGAGGAPAADLSTPLAPDGEQLTLALSAGASRGAYQAGVVYAVLSHFRSVRTAHNVASIPAISGSSIGAINALIGGIDWCLADDEAPLPENNPLWDIWGDLSWDEMFPGDLTCTQYGRAHPEIDLRCTGDRPYLPGEGLFSRNGLEPSIRQMLRQITGARFRPGCDVTIAVPIVEENPETIALGNKSISTARRHVSVRLFSPPPVRGADGTTPSKSSLSICAWRSASGVASTDERSKQAARARGIAGRAVELPHVGAPTFDGACEPIDPFQLVEAVLSSGSWPPLLVPQPLLYCDDQPCDRAPASPAGVCGERQHLCQQRFVDGSLYDRVPLAAAVEAAPFSGRYLAIDGAAHKDPKDDADKKKDDAPLRGARFYVRAASDFLSVASDYEMQTLEREKVLDETRQSFDTTHPGLPLVGDYLHGYASFLDRRFLRYDYLMGVTDGIFWIGWESCRQKHICSPVGKPQESDQRAVAQEVLALFGSDLLSHDNDPWNAKAEVQLRSSRALRFLTLKRLEWELFGSAKTDARDPFTDAETRLLRQDKGARDTQMIFDALSKTQIAHDKRFPKASADLPMELDDSIELAGQLSEAHIFDPDRKSDFVFDPDRKSDFVSRHEPWFAKTSQQVMARLELVERADGQESNATVLGIGEYAASVRLGRTQAGLQLGSASIPARVWRSEALGSVEKFVLPYSLMSDARNGGGTLAWELGMYRPYWAVRWRLPTIGFAAHWFRYGDEPGTRLGPTLGIGVDLPWNVISELGVRGWWHPFQHDDGWSAVGGEAYVRPIFGRLEVGFGVRSIHSAPFGAYLNVGLTDVNGLLYWIFRSVTGDDEAFLSLVSRAGSTAGLP